MPGQNCVQRNQKKPHAFQQHLLLSQLGDTRAGNAALAAVEELILVANLYLAGGALGVKRRLSKEASFMKRLQYVADTV